MKVLFTLGVGVAIGWASALFDAAGQLALEQHQEKVNELIYQASAPEKVEEAQNSRFFSFIWP
ncbi:hypothetical protein [Rufibacter aurantiacus]|uniref:hypothetical protein n=1 Tax=Rufibacter aurantiacus TaxID=2817374 RepID=UPI001B30BFAF|nr:hypothetical protein [Rufibacter aurantiacus]